VESRSGGQNHGAFSTLGTWADSTSKSTAEGTTPGIGSVYSSSTYDGRTATYSFTPDYTGTYDVSVTWVHSTNACPSAEHIVGHAGGSTTVYMDQLSGGNAWNSLGEYQLNAGTLYTVVQRTDGSTGGGVLRADAVRWQLASVPVEPPVITLHPVSQDVCPGATAVFDVSAGGQGPLGYQWQKNGADLSNGGHYSGVTTPTLTVSNADGADVADYRCVVSNAGGDTPSNAAGLTLKSATVITQDPQSQEVGVGDNVTFSVQAVGEGSLSYQWQKDGGDLSDDGRISGATTATLQITSVEMSDAGGYRCVVNGECGGATSNEATLTVVEPYAPVDFDRDDDVDGADFGHFQVCLSGTSFPQNDPSCQDAKLDEDSDVDELDLVIFVGCLRGDSVPADLSCAD
jgi:hypothetical protein